MFDIAKLTGYHGKINGVVSYGNNLCPVACSDEAAEHDEK